MYFYHKTVHSNTASRGIDNKTNILRRKPATDSNGLLHTRRQQTTQSKRREKINPTALLSSLHPSFAIK